MAAAVEMLLASGPLVEGAALAISSFSAAFAAKGKMRGSANKFCQRGAFLGSKCFVIISAT
eukprot:4429216-Pyramimonas_sp.AAC.1